MVLIHFSVAKLLWILGLVSALNLCGKDCTLPLTARSLVLYWWQFNRISRITTIKFRYELVDLSMQVFANYLLQRVADKEAPFQLRLHLIYLINDVLHHCQRKNVEGEARKKWRTWMCVSIYKKVLKSLIYIRQWSLRRTKEKHECFYGFIYGLCSIHLSVSVRRVDHIPAIWIPFGSFWFAFSSFHLHLFEFGYGLN